MLKKILFAFVFTFSFAISAQTELIVPAGDGGFENGASLGANGWTYNFPLSGPPFDFWNQWAVGTGATAGFSGSNCAYVSNSSTAATPTHTYINQNIRSRFFRDITFPAIGNTITLSFDWICAGEANIDEMTVWLVPTSYNPAFNLPATTTTGVAPTGRIELGSNFHSQGTWTSATITVPPAYAGTTSRLLFEWSSNGSGTIGTPPAAVDNISLISENIPVYCTPTTTPPGTLLDWIEDFSTNVGGGSDISNLNTGYTTNGYQDYSATHSVEQLAGGLINFEAVWGHTSTPFNLGFNIWVDWNGDGDFTDTGEKVYASGGTVATGVDADFTIPLATIAGDYRMRIRAQFANGDPSSCGDITYGEAEDYTLTVLDVNCTDDPSNIIVSAIGFTDAIISWTAATPAPGIGYEYFVVTNTNVPIYNQIPTGTTNSVTTTANLTGLIDGTTYYVWVRSVCDGSFGGTGNWFGPEPFTTQVSPPTTTGVTICPGDPSEDLSAVSSDCAASTNLGTQLSGALDGVSGPVAFQPNLPIGGGGSSTVCAFKTNTANYDTIDFTVDATGSYTFTMEVATPDFDAMAYIFINDGNFTPGSCATGTWVVGDDDSGPGLYPAITVTLTAGVNYTLVTTKWSGILADTTHTGPYTWNFSGPGSLLGPPSGSMDWYTTASGGSSIFSGIYFDPVVDGTIPLGNTNTTGIYTYWAACASSPTVRTQADFVIGKVWDGTLGNTDWATATNWSPNGIPDSTDCVVIPNTGFDPVIDGSTDGLGYRLIIESGATLTQNANSSLTITDAITVNAGGTYNMLDDSSLIQENSVANTVNGTFTMERTTSPIIENDYVYWSSPVAPFNIQDVSPGTPNGFKYEWLPTVGSRLPGPGPAFVPNDYGDWQATDTGVMSPGKGYAIKAPSGHLASTPLTTLFSGTPNNGSISQTIEKGTYTGADYTYIPNGAASLTVTSDDDNWNFIGNPYPSALHLEDFLYHGAHSDHIDGTAYLWTHNTDIGTNGQSFYEEFTYSYSGVDYLMVNATGNSVPDPYKGFVAAGQGFFVRMTDFSANVTQNVYFENYMRRAEYRNDQFFRSADSSAEENTESTENKHRIWLDFIDSSGNTNTTLIGYVNEATNEKDRIFDGKKTKGAGLNLYSMINDDAYIIQGRQLPFVDSDTVPLGLNITEAGIQTIAINTLEGLFHDTEQNIYIEDFVTGITHNLNNAPYTFTSEIGIINDRFVLRYTPNSSLGIEDFNTLSGIKVFEENDDLVVKSEYETIQSIEVYDILGRNLFTDTSINQTRFTVSAISPNNATLFLKIKLVDGQLKIAKIIF